MLSISIVTKTYNRLPMLLECIDSVQHLRNEPHEEDIKWEHVVYDDGSTDGTKEFFAHHHVPHTRYIRSEKNSGISVAANSAITQCESEYIFEVDSDDIVPQRVLSNFYDTLQEYPQCEWAIADFYRMGENGVYSMGQDYFGWRFRNCEEILSAIFSGNHFIQHNVLYTRRLWEKIGKYDENLTMAEDLDLYIRFLLADKMPCYVPYISHFHRIHPANISREVDEKAHQKDLALLYRKYQNPLRERRILCPFE